MESVLSFLAKNPFVRTYLLSAPQMLPLSAKSLYEFWQTQPIDVIVDGEMPWYRGATAPRIDLFYPTKQVEL
jgi:hypothetical protein